MQDRMTLPEKNASAQSTVDDAMIRSIANGDMDALHTMYEAVSGSIYGFALSITKHPHDAEDVLQDTFLTIHRAAANYTSQGKPMAWILTIARNHALIKLRARSREGDSEGLPEAGEACARLTDAEQRAVIQTLLSGLGDEERQIVMLHAVAGMKNREIAALLELPLNTVLSKYHRAIKKLRDSIAKEAL